jgi:mTERF domain-containing protein
MAAKRNRSLFMVSLERIIKPNIALFRQWGVQDIAQLCSSNPWVLSFHSERVKEFLLRAEELGVPPTSRMFRHAVAVITKVSKERVVAKLEFLKRTLGCSEYEVSVV